MAKCLSKHFTKCCNMFISCLVWHLNRKKFMKLIDILIVRIYISESSHLLDKLTHYLNQEIKIRGISVFRAISGFGKSGEHTSALVDLSLDLPLIIEFFDDDKSKIEAAVDHINSIV